MGSSRTCLILVVVVTLFYFSISVQGEKYSSIVVENGEEEDVEIFNEGGELVTTVESFADEDYEIIKPANENVCYVKPREGSKQHACGFIVIPITIDIPSRVREHCNGSEIQLLEANTDCEETELDTVRRAKRASTWSKCRRWTYVIVERCVKEECDKWGWWFGKNTCKRYRCVESETVREWIEHTAEGYESKF